MMSQSVLIEALMVDRRLMARWSCGCGLWKVVMMRMGCASYTRETREW
jgi:hypothetical protein